MHGTFSCTLVVVNDACSNCYSIIICNKSNRFRTPGNVNDVLWWCKISYVPGCSSQI